MLRRKTELEEMLLELGYKMLAKHYSQKNTELTDKYTYKKKDKEWYVEINSKRDTIVDFYFKPSYDYVGFSNIHDIEMEYDSLREELKEALNKWNKGE